MKRITMLAVAAVLLSQPVASADSGSTHTGQCWFVDHDLVDGVGSSADELLAVAVIAVRDAAGQPAGAEVRCELWINNSRVANASASGSGVVVVADTVMYGAPADADFDFCTVVDYADATPTATECVSPQPIRIPPDIHPDTFGTLNEILVEHVDPRLCAALKTLTLPPDLPVQVNEQGDVYVLGEPVWDCPPYDTWPL